MTSKHNFRRIALIPIDISIWDFRRQIEAKENVIERQNSIASHSLRGSSYDFNEISQHT